MRILVITDGGEALAQKVHALGDAGASVLIREPALPPGLPLDRVILHARMPGAAAVAHALHLSADMDVVSWRARFAGPLGVSAHSREAALAALAAGADYALLSPIFAARHGRDALGPGGLAGLWALGGVLPEHLGICRDHGALGVAVQSHIWRATDPIAALRSYRPTTPPTGLDAEP
ncbi:MAG: hypothetical protein EXR71_05685 [Myxococcales bacterium]|nr:hypothetical protein [Myxococcales bacterium]